MGQSISIKPDTFKAYEFEDEAKALKIKHSKGSSKGSRKGRLHLFSYSGKAGKDPYAVAAEAIKVGDQPPKLGIIDRHYYVLVKLEVQDPNDSNKKIPTWYKVNKRSLKYRLGIQSKDIDVDSKTKVCTNFEKLIADKEASIQKNKENLLKSLKNYASVLRNESDNLKNDKNFMLEAVKINGLALAYASPKLQNDRDVVLAALESEKTKHENSITEALSGFVGSDDEKAVALNNLKTERIIYFGDFAFAIAPLHLRRDKDFILEAIQIHPRAFQYAHNDLKNDKAFVQELVKHDGRLLGYAHADLQNDRDVVLEAIMQNGNALADASSSLRQDKDIVWTAYTQDKRAIRFADASLTKDRDFMLKAIDQSYGAFFHAHADLKNDKAFVLEAIRLNGHRNIYYSLSSALERDREVVLEAVKQDKDILRFVGSLYNDDKEIVLAAVQNDRNALQYASQRLQDELRAELNL